MSTQDHSPTNEPTPEPEKVSGPGCAESTGSDSSTFDELMEKDDDEDYEDRRCHFCDGDGYVFGEDLDDPLWYDENKIYRCPCCRGTGDAKDCTFW